MIVIIDGDFIPYVACQGNKILDENGEPIKVDGKFTYTPKTLEEVYKYVDDLLLSLFTKLGSFQYIGFLGDGINFRYNIYPEYKANRKDFVKPEFFKECKQYLYFNHCFNLCEDVEADDNVLTSRTLLNKQGIENIIVTTDKDLTKCTEGQFFNAKTWEYVYTLKDDADYNFWLSCLTGDTTDNIKGVPKIGEVKARKILEESYSCIPSLISKVHQEYINYFGEYKGILEFTKNYQLLKILTEQEGFVLPEVQEFKI